MLKKLVIICVLVVSALICGCTPTKDVPETTYNQTEEVDEITNVVTEPEYSRSSYELNERDLDSTPVLHTTEAYETEPTIPSEKTEEIVIPSTETVYQPEDTSVSQESAPTGENETDERG